MDKWYYDISLFFSQHIPSSLYQEMLHIHGSPGVFVPYSGDHVQRPRLTPDKYTSKTTPF